MPDEALPPGTPFTLHVTAGGSFVTVAASCPLVPASMLAGAPEIATDGTIELTETDTVAAAGERGKPLVESYATYENESGPL